ncbi:ornithine carbamoyltransferase [Coemansia sp. RSA 988]|nr:ornithine carbamoyltransferase [Coemansia sp. RSA 988]
MSPMSNIKHNVVSSDGCTGASVGRQLHSTALKSLPRDMISLNDYSAEQIAGLIESAVYFKHKSKQEGQAFHPDQPLKGKTIGLIFSKRSTRTRVASETSAAYLGGHALFLGKDDIQLGVNETLRDSAQVISSMVDGIFARVGPHSDITTLAKYSSVPVINALCEENHPTQILADLMTIWEVFGKRRPNAGGILEVFRGLRLAWVGDANNIAFETMTTMPKCGISVNMCSPAGYPIPEYVRKVAEAGAKTTDAEIKYFSDPIEAVNGADIIVTDTWISMGQEEEKTQRLLDFNGYQVSKEMAQKGNANKDWIFMHCLPRKPEEVTDEIFYSDRSVVFQEAENRKWTTIATFNALLGKKSNE